MSKKYLVTGGSGFIGAALVKALVNKGNKVSVIDNNSRGSASKLGEYINKIKFYKGDIRDYSFVKSCLDGVDSVIHLAYINGTEFFYEKPDLILDVGIRGTFNIIDACREKGIKEFVLASSSEAYQTPSIIPTPEDVPLVVPDIMNPRYSYGGGKIACELLAINYGRKYFDRVLVFRPHNVYGADMGFEHVIPQFVMRASELILKKNEGIIGFSIQGDGTETRAFVHINDFTDGVLAMLEKGEHLNIYHIGNNEEIEIKKLVGYIFEYFNRDYVIIPGELKSGGTLRRCPDISKMKKIGYNPQISIKKGLPEVIDWYHNYNITKMNKRGV